MPTQIDWSEAEAAVGKDDPGTDWMLNPEKHADALPARANALKRVLEQDAVQDVMQRYRELDTEANQQQKRFRSSRFRIAVTAYMTAFSGLLALSMHLILSYQSDLQFVFVVVHVLLLAYIIFETARLNKLDPRKKWLEARGRSELLRVALFDLVVSAQQPSDVAEEIELLPLQLAYFRRYQLDVQLRYLEGRGKQLIRTTGMNPWYTALCGIIAVVAFVLTGIAVAHLAHDHGLPVPTSVILVFKPQVIEQVAYWAFLCLAVSTIYALLMTHQTVSEDQRNGTRYLSLYENLKFLKNNSYEQVRKAAELNDHATVETFVALVHEQMTAEQNEWVSLQRMVENQDRVLAASTAKGLTELFSQRFEEADNGGQQDTSLPKSR